jgi:hypothetical protein
MVWQLLESAVAALSVHVAWLNWSALVEENATVPVGALAVPGEVSVTVAVQVLGDPTATGFGEHESVVAVVRVVTATVVDPLLAMWLGSPW